MIVQFFFVQNDHLKSCDLCKISMHPFLRCPCRERAMFLQNYKGYGDPTAPVKLYNIYGFKQQPHRNGNLGIRVGVP